MKSAILLNPSFSKKQNIGYLLTAIFLFSASILLYLWLYSMVGFKGAIDWSTIARASSLTVPVLLFSLGVLLVINSVNKNNKLVQLIGILTLWAFLNAIFMQQQVAVAVIILVISGILFIVIQLLIKLISFLFSLALSSFMVIPIIYIIIMINENLKLNMSWYAAIYLGITIYLFVFIRFGVRITSLFLHLLSNSKWQEKYNYCDLKNQMNLVYLFAFIIINLFFMYNKEENIVNIANCFNNALITGTCAMNVNWKSILEKRNN